MLLFRLALQRIFRHWRTYIFLLIGLSFGSGLLAGLPLYSRALAFDTLKESIQLSHPVERNIEIIGDNSNLTGGMARFVDELIGDLKLGRVEVRKVSLGVDVQEAVIPSKFGERISPDQLNILSLDKLTNYTNLIEGQFPEYRPPVTREEILRAMTKPPDIQAAIGYLAASELGIKNGDVVVDSLGRHYPIVGIIEPLNPEDDVWWGDMTAIQTYRRPGINEDTISLSLIIHPSSLREFYPGHDLSWRILIDHSKFTSDNIRSLEQRILNLKGRIEPDGALLRSNLPNLLEKYRMDSATLRTVVYLLSIQAVIFILYGLILIQNQVLGTVESEISTMVARGSGILQIVILSGIEGLIFALLSGLFIGPLVAVVVLSIWFDFPSGFLDSSILLESGVFSIIGAGVGWLVLLIGSYSLSRRNIVTFQKNLSRVENEVFWKKYYLDVFLIAVSALAYWQLTNSGSFVRQRFRDTEIVDPLLLLSPTIFLISISLILLRLSPQLMKFFSLIYRSSRRVIIPLSLLRLSRVFIRPTQIILLISIAASMMLFSSSYENSVWINQRAISRYNSGADIRISKSDLTANEILALPGVVDCTEVFRREVQVRTGKTITFLAVNPSSFSNIASFPPGMTNITIREIVNVLNYKGGYEDEEITLHQADDIADNPYLTQDKDELSLPAVFSYDTITPNMDIGDKQDISILGNSISLEIRGLIQNFPTLGKGYVLIDIAGLAEHIDLDRPEYHANRELWLLVEPEKYSDVIDLPYVKENLLSDFNSALITMQENGFIRGAIGAFRLNTLILTLLSTLIFSLLTYFSSMMRKYEFGIMRAEGLSSKQLIGILVTEGLTVVFLGLLLGTLIGIGWLYIMRPYLNSALSEAFPGMIVYEVSIDWQQLLYRYGILILIYGVSLGIAVGLLIKTGIHQVLRMGAE